MKQQIIDAVMKYKSQINAMGDFIYDHPETGLREFECSKLICDTLEKEGYTVERGIAGLETAFRGVYEQGTGGVSIGLLIEYDALEGADHACTHHIEAGIMIYMAKALREGLGKDQPYKLVMYGTPAEEVYGGKVTMAEQGFFQDIDIALMVHGWNTTTVDTSNLAMSSYVVTFHGKAAHAAVEPESGISALDALLLTFQGVEFLREHVRDDIRMHYTVLNAGGPANVVPEKASGKFMLRSRYKPALQRVVERFTKIVEGAALMTGAAFDIEREDSYDNKVPSFILNDVILDNARTLNAPGIKEPEANGGSSDFGNVMYIRPGCCLRIQVIEDGSQAHSKNWYEIGKSDKIHDRQVLAAQILAGVCYDLITDPALVKKITDEHTENRAKADSIQ